MRRHRISASLHIDACRSSVEEFIALPVELQFVTDRGDVRAVCGIVAQAAAGQSDGGLATYQLVVRDALALMDQRVNTRVFRNINETELSAVLLSEWRAINPILANALDGLEAAEMRNRWWGEVHSDSYGPLLADLHLKLNNTFVRAVFGGERKPSYHWDKVMKYDRAKWNAADMPALTEAELEKFAQYQYPVYACGYNWIQSNERSAERLKSRVLDIIKFWTDRKFDCKQVILVTHSMGGLVGRACAKQIPTRLQGWCTG